MTRQVPALGLEAHDQLCANRFATHFRGLVVLADLLGADDAENVVQEAFFRLHGARSRLRDPAVAQPTFAGL